MKLSYTLMIGAGCALALVPRMAEGPSGGGDFDPTSGGGASGSPSILVHHPDAEGALVIDGVTGRITQPIDERPEWSEGLAVAMLGERLEFYTKRLGVAFADEHRAPESLDYRDLTWLGMSADALELEETEDRVHIQDPETALKTIEADPEYRMQMLAEVIGFSRDLSAEDGITLTTGIIAAEVEVSLDVNRTDAELSALDKAREADFSEGRKTATGG